MRWMDRLASRLRSLFKRQRVERELDAELQFHLDQQVEENLATGMSVEEARSSALRSLGTFSAVKERCRDSLGLRLVDDVGQDIRYAFRTLVKNPGFTLVAVLTLALGIGANTAIFSVVNAVLLRPLPYKDSDRLVRIFENVPRANSPSAAPRRTSVIDGSQLAVFRSQTQTLSHVGMFGFGATMWRTGRDETTRVSGLMVSPAILQMLGAQPIMGRTFESREETQGAGLVVILSYSAWQRHFGGDPNILGQSVAIEPNRVMGAGNAYVVVGVLAQGFQFPDRQTEFWIPLPAPIQGRGPAPAIARLKDGVSMQTAAAEVSTVLQQLRDNPPGSRFELVGLQDQLVAPVRPALVVLAAAVGFVLLIACVNLANLLLARTAARQREIAVRLALGAGRGRLVRQILTESVLLALAGGVAAIALAYGGIQLLQSLATSLPRPDLGSGVSLPRLDEIGIDAAVLAFTLAVSLLTGVLFGLAPAMYHSRPRPMDILREGAGSAISGFNLFRRNRMQGLLVVWEIGMAMMLFVGGGLLMHSFVRLSNVDPGYDPTHVLTFQMPFPRGRSSDDQVTKFGDDLVARLQSMSGVRAAGYAEALPTVPLARYGNLRTTPEVSNPARPWAGSTPEQPDVRVVSRDFLTAMSIRLIAGRGFGERDGPGYPQVMLINRTMARSGFLGENPIGKHVYVDFGRSDRAPQPWEIVGIVGDVRQVGLDREPDPQVFVDFRQFPGPRSAVGHYFAVRTDTDATSLVASIRAIARQLDSQATVDNVATMEQLVSNSIARRRLFAVLLGIFAAVAVTLAAIGIYGVMAYSVAQRIREIGIRMALGAARSQVMGLVLGESAVLIGVGIVLGVAGAAAATRYLEGMLFGLTPLDPTTFVAVVVLFALVATLAAFVPARQATKVDPMVALRCE